MALAPNNLLQAVAKNEICTAFGIKLVTGAEIVHIAHSAGYDSLFIDLEHTTITLKEAGQLCITAISSGITPFVRVPHQCGEGFIQRVLDMGAFGVIVPHIRTPEEVQSIVRVSKYPPEGKRSVTGYLPHYRMVRINPARAQNEINSQASTVFIMIETLEALSNVDAIAALPGCDVLLIGCQDLSMELDVPGQLDHPRFIEALSVIANAARNHGKILGIAGAYTRPYLIEKFIREHGARWIVGAQDIALLQQGGEQNVQLLKSIGLKAIANVDKI